jgi:hypothetical protein
MFQGLAEFSLLQSVAQPNPPMFITTESIARVQRNSISVQLIQVLLHYVLPKNEAYAKPNEDGKQDQPNVDP